MAKCDGPQLLGFGLANYRSFDAAGFVVEDLRKINIFIGKNNCGKSNVLRAMEVLRALGRDETTKLVPVVDGFRGGAPPSAIVVLSPQAILARAGLEHLLEKGQHPVKVRFRLAGGQVEDTSLLSDFSLKELNDIMGNWANRHFTRLPADKADFLTHLSFLVELCHRALASWQPMLFIPNFREIRQTADNQAKRGEEYPLAIDGRNVIARLRSMQNPAVGKEKDQEIFHRIEQFVRELLDVNELRMEIQADEDRIILTIHRNRLPLESFGTGVHQLVILCSALAMYENHVVSIEEPEIHVHPELQRKFLRFIADDTNNQYFITTHSNVFLDFLPDVAVYHVTHDGEKTTVRRVDTTPKARDILTDMGYKASDLLQANGVIWVEGPSDRLYLNRWLSLIAPDLVEGIDYSIAFFGGKVLAHFCCEDDPLDDLVEVLRINRNAFFMIDRDGDSSAATLNASKERILKETGPDSCWITKGREVENYLRPQLINRYLTDKYSKGVEVHFEPDDRLDEAIAAAVKGLNPSTQYAKEKVGYARELCKLMTTDDLDVLDLRYWLEKLVKQVGDWSGSA